jgi:hypothetical protein
VRARSWIVEVALAAVLPSLAACAYYENGITLRPLVEFQMTIEGPTKGAPPRMLGYNRELQVQCAYCHVDADATTANLTPEGTASRLMIDLADRFKVSCGYCHDRSATKLTQAGNVSLRDLRDPARKWVCARCHTLGFKLLPGADAR